MDLKKDSWTVGEGEGGGGGEEPPLLLLVLSEEGVEPAEVRFLEAWWGLGRRVVGLCDLEVVGEDGGALLLLCLCC